MKKMRYNSFLNKMVKNKKIFVSVILLVIICLGGSIAISYQKHNYKIETLESKIIKTDRLVLTKTSDEDFDCLAEYLLNKDVTKNLDPSLSEGFSSKEEALSFLKSESSGQEYSKAIEFTIKLKEKNNLPIGKFDLMLTGNDDKYMVGLGYWLGKDYQGKGYASEAGYKIGNMAFKAKNVESLYATSVKDNLPSIKLAKKIFDNIEENSKNQVYRYEDNFDEYNLIMFTLSKKSRTE